MKQFSNHTVILKKGTSFAIKWSAISIAGIILLAGIVFCVLQLDFTSEFLVNIVNSSFLEKKSAKIEISGIKGIIPFRFRIRELDISDKSGKWLIVRNCSLSVSPADLFRGRLFIKMLHIGGVEVERTPPYRESGNKNEPYGFRIPSIAAAITIGNLRVSNINLNRSIIGRPARFSISGDIIESGAGDAKNLSLKIEGNNGFTGSLMASISRDNGSPYMHLRLSAEDPGRGILYHLAGMGEDFSLFLEGKGRLSDWQGSLCASSRDAGKITSDIQIKSGRDYHLNMSGNFMPAGSLMDKAYYKIAQEGIRFKIETVLADKQKIFFHLFELKTGGTEALFKGRIAPANLDSDGHFSLIINDLSGFDKVLKERVSGRISVEGSIKGYLLAPDIGLTYTVSDFGSKKFKATEMKGTGRVDFQHENVLKKTINISGDGNIHGLHIELKDSEYHEKKINYRFDLAQISEKRWDIKLLKIDSGYFSVRTSGYLDVPDKQASLEGRLKAIDLSKLYPQVGSIAWGNGDLEFNIRAGFMPVVIDASIKGSYRPGQENGVLRKLTADDMSFEGSVHLEDDKIRFTRVRIHSHAASVEAHGVYDLNGMVDFQGKAALPQLDIFSSYAGKPLKGRAEGEFFLNGDLSRLEISSSAEVKDLVWGGIRAGRVSGRIKDIHRDKYDKGKIAIELTHKDYVIKIGSDFLVSGNKISLDDIGLSGADASITGNADFNRHHISINGKLDFTSADMSKIAGLFGQDMKGALSGKFLFKPEQEKQGIRFSASAKDLIIEKHMIKNIDLSGTLSDIFGKPYFKTHATVRGYNNEVGSVGIDGFFKYDNHDMSADLRMGKIPLNILSPAGMPLLDGTLSGDCRLRGSPSRPEISGNMRIDGIRRKNLKNKRTPSIFIKVEYNFNKESFKGWITLGNLTGNITIPCDFSIYPFTFAPIQADPVSGSIRGDFELSVIPAVFEIQNQILTGTLNTDFDIGGTYRSPSITGKARLLDGRYENPQIGLMFNHIAADISAENSGFVLHSLKADDGLKGSVKGSGRIDINPIKGFSYKMNMSFNNMQLIENDRLTAVLSGDTSISGSVREQKVSSRLTLEKAEFQIPEKLPVEITELDIKEINKKGSPVPPEEKKRPAEESSIKLDINVSSSGRVYINGRGLSSEWKGNLTLKGTADKPVITGKLSLVRGNYSFLSKNFTLTQGSVTFSGNSPPDPRLDVTGKIVNSSITAFVNLTGNIKKPSLSLSSEPALPRDEILSRVLFDREISQITPLQAIRLAGAVNDMLGGESFNALDYARNLIGVDRLEIKQLQGGTNSSAISAGKYLNDNIYLEVEKGIGAKSGKASVTWELTPNITVDTEVGETSGTEMGINWKYDY